MAAYRRKSLCGFKIPERERVPNDGVARQYAPGVEIREIASSTVTTNQKK